MTAKIVNLNKQRKDRARAERKLRADANAVKFGRTKAEQQRDKLRTERAETHLDGHKRDDT